MKRKPSTAPPGDWLGDLSRRENSNAPAAADNFQTDRRPSEALADDDNIQSGKPKVNTLSDASRGPAGSPAARRPNGLDFLPFPEPRPERDARPPLLERAHDAPDYFADGGVRSLPALVDAADGRRARVVERGTPAQVPRRVAPVGDVGRQRVQSRPRP